jgi:glycerate kinase
VGLSHEAAGLLVKDERLRVLVAPDSFKGSLTSVEVARAFARGWQAVRPYDDVVVAPLADGGEGSVAAMAEAGGWRRRHSIVQDPLGRPVRARWLQSSNGSRACIELASASGLSILRGVLAPLDARTTGTGQLLLAAIAAGATRIIIGIGGSATTDGGMGMLESLGARIRWTSGEPSGANGDHATVDLASLEPRLAGVELRVACDVANPLLGPTGAAGVYGPQKGAGAAEVARLDRRLAAWADALEKATGRRERETPGAGAAGGVGFCLLCLRDRFLSFDLVPGVALMMEETGFPERLAASDVVITGEGLIDGQTAFGKTAMGVARMAAAADVLCIAIGGGVWPDGEAALAQLGAISLPVVERPMSLSDAISAGPQPLWRAAARAARLVSAGRILWARR